MTEALGALVFVVGLIGLVFTSHVLVRLWHDWAGLKRQEAAYADEWRRVHKAHQDLGRYGDPNPNRYLVDDEKRPE